jgi:hypothetical protein
MNPRECVLYSGGLRGAEAAFGEAAERHGVEELNFTFEGHRIERGRGVRTLSAAELQHGDVSLEYVSKLMNRHYPETDTFKKVLQTIWHQVNNAQEVYVVGKILPDDTVMGGTGWGAEFAKLCNKPLFVYDQDREGWFHWTEEKFEPVKDPVIKHPLVCGTGTRFPTAAGLTAIDGLFDRTFK